MLKIFEIFVGQPFRVSLISGIEKFYAEEGYVTIFCRIFLSRSTEKFCRAKPSVLCFRKFLIVKKLMDKREGEDQDFPWKFFCLIVPKHFVEEPFSVGFQKNSVSEKVYGYEGGESIKIFFRKYFVSQCRNIL